MNKTLMDIMIFALCGGIFLALLYTLWWTRSGHIARIKDLQQTKTQLSVNFNWILERIDNLHRIICPKNMIGTWQERVEYVVAEALRLHRAAKLGSPRYQCTDKRHYVAVERYAFTQFRLQLCDSHVPP